MNVNFYVTLLDPSCSMILGYNWLTCYNPLIDWVLGSIILHPQLLDPSFLKLMSSARAAKLPPQNPSISDETPKLPASAPSVALIGAAPFMRLCRLQGMQTFCIHLSDISVSTNSASISEEAPDLSNIPEEYHDFANVFSKAKAEKLVLRNSLFYVCYHGTIFAIGLLLLSLYFCYHCYLFMIWTFSYFCYLS